MDGVSLSVQAGDAVADVRENAAGKSRLMRICAGLIRSTVTEMCDKDGR